MRLPNAEDAVVDIVKIQDYCLNPDHSKGKHKARVFLKALGIDKNDAVTRTALVRTTWIIRIGENFPRLATCFIL